MKPTPEQIKEWIRAAPTDEKDDHSLQCAKMCIHVAYKAAEWAKQKELNECVQLCDLLAKEFAQDHKAESEGSVQKLAYLVGLSEGSVACKITLQNKDASLAAFRQLDVDQKQNDIQAPLGKSITEILHESLCALHEAKKHKTYRT